MINPELRRNLWLEISLHRLLMMPLLIALLIAVSWVSNGYRFTHDVAQVSIWIFVLVTLVWGAKRVGDSLYEEQAERTWEWQRISGIPPWSLTWGKWLGASAYPWYGGLIALLAYLLIMVSIGRPVEGAKSGALMVLGALLAQGLGLVVALLAMRRGEVTSRHRGAMVLIVLLLLFTAVPAWIETGADRGWRWYQWQVDALDFWLLSAAAFVAWFALGAYRLMRGELLYRGTPVWWVAFLLFLLAYAGGFADGVEARWLAAFAITAFFAMGCALVEPKDPVEWRVTLEAWRRGDRRRWLEGVPLWAVSLLLALVVACGFQLVPGERTGMGLGLNEGLDEGVRRAVLLASLFLSRDVLLLLFVSLNPGSRRPEAATILYLAVLYLPLPWLFMALDLEWLTVAFWPRPDIEGGAPLMVVAAQVVVMLVLLRLRWGARVGR